MKESAAPKPVPFICPDCGFLTRDPKHIAEGYCPLCQWWTGDPVWRSYNPDSRWRNRLEPT